MTSSPFNSSCSTSSRGQDLLADGGPVVVLRLDTDGGRRSVEQLEAPCALLGRKNQGEALLLRWSGAELGGAGAVSVDRTLVGFGRMRAFASLLTVGLGLT